MSCHGGATIRITSSLRPRARSSTNSATFTSSKMRSRKRSGSAASASVCCSASYSSVRGGGGGGGAAAVREAKTAAEPLRILRVGVSPEREAVQEGRAAAAAKRAAVAAEGAALAEAEADLLRERGDCANVALVAVIGHERRDGARDVARVVVRDDGQRALGVFVHRKDTGSGPVDWKGVKLRWTLGADRIDAKTPIKISVPGKPSASAPAKPVAKPTRQADDFDALSAKEGDALAAHQGDASPGTAVRLHRPAA
jgi:hypothetical protein